MKLSLFIIIALLSVCEIQAQFKSRQYFKQNEIDGWIKITESEWFTVSQRGDTTYFTQTLEETNQDDPNQKPKYEFDGLGNIVKPDTVVKRIVEQPIVKYASNPVRVDTFSISSAPITVYKDRTKTKYKKSKPIYKYKNGKTVYKYVKPKLKPEKYTPINIITYKKNLWVMTVGARVKNKPYVYSRVVEASTEKAARVKFAKHLKTEFPSIVFDDVFTDQFSQFDIIK